jgi:microsomal dipeptidase-like Zn-dependent dipeptidase
MRRRSESPSFSDRPETSTHARAGRVCDRRGNGRGWTLPDMRASGGLIQAVLRRGYGSREAVMDWAL